VRKSSCERQTDDPGKVTLREKKERENGRGRIVTTHDAGNRRNKWGGEKVRGSRGPISAAWYTTEELGTNDPIL